MGETRKQSEVFRFRETAKPCFRRKRVLAWALEGTARPLSLRLLISKSGEKKPKTGKIWRNQETKILPVFGDPESVLAKMAIQCWRSRVWRSSFGALPIAVVWVFGDVRGFVREMYTVWLRAASRCSCGDLYVFALSP